MHKHTLLESEAKAICIEYDIPTPNYEVASDSRTAAQYAEQLGYPVVLKVVSPDILHKTEAKCVLTSLDTAQKVMDGFESILSNAKKFRADARIIGVLVQRMAPAGLETIVGSVKDRTFGQTLMFGLGGVFVEVLRDVSFRIAPIKDTDAKNMIQEIRSSKVLDGYRGQPPADKNAIVNILLNLSRLVCDYPQIDQIDLNPTIVYEKGASVVDARIVLES
jgi:acetyl-CoA synthetase (ADP-forming)